MLGPGFLGLATCVLCFLAMSDGPKSEVKKEKKAAEQDVSALPMSFQRNAARSHGGHHPESGAVVLGPGLHARIRVLGSEFFIYIIQMKF